MDGWIFKKGHKRRCRPFDFKGWKGGFSKKGPSGDVDDVSGLFDFKGWKGGFSK